MGACLSLPFLGTSSQQTFISNDSFECAVFCTKNEYRKKMEDKHMICLSLPNHPNYSLFGVFDGFNGDEASTYCAENIVNALDSLDNIEDNDAIIRAIEEMDAEYLDSCSTNDEYNANAGCTLVFALINTSYRNETAGSHMPNNKATLQQIHSSSLFTAHSLHYTSDAMSGETSSSEEHEPLKFVPDDMGNGFRVRVFWAGDSRAAVMSNNGELHRLTHDHNCSAPQEAKRILNANGTIIRDRIDGIVAVTRGFGCFIMKNDDSLAPNQQKMSPVPEYTEIWCTNEDRLLLFCDGLVETWSDSQFSIRCKHHMMQQQGEKKGNLYAVTYLCEQAMDEGSKDNLTMLCIQFK